MNLIVLVIEVALFCLAAYGGAWICERYQLPKPVLWIFGVLLLVFLLILVANQFGAGLSMFTFPSLRR